MLFFLLKQFLSKGLLSKEDACSDYLFPYFSVIVQTCFLCAIN